MSHLTGRLHRPKASGQTQRRRLPAVVLVRAGLPRHPSVGLRVRGAAVAASSGGTHSTRARSWPRGARGVRGDAKPAPECSSAAATVARSSTRQPLHQALPADHRDKAPATGNHQGEATTASVEAAQAVAQDSAGHDGSPGSDHSLAFATHICCYAGTLPGCTRDESHYVRCTRSSHQDIWVTKQPICKCNPYDLYRRHSSDLGLSSQ